MDNIVVLAKTNEVLHCRVSQGGNRSSLANHADTVMLLQNGRREHIANRLLQHVMQRARRMGPHEQSDHLLRLHDGSQPHRQHVVAFHHVLVLVLLLLVDILHAIVRVEPVVQDERGACLLTRATGEAAARSVSSDTSLRIHLRAYKAKTTTFLYGLFETSAFLFEIHRGAVQKVHILRASIHILEEILIHPRRKATLIVLGNTSELLQLEENHVTERNSTVLIGLHQDVVSTLDVLKKNDRGFIDGRGFGSTSVNGFVSVLKYSDIWFTM